MELKCSTCEKIKNVTEFSKQNNKKRGYSYKCKQCHNEYSKNNWYPKNQKKQIESSGKWRNENKLQYCKTKYKLSEDINFLKEEYEKCDNTCQICQKKSDLCLDHCHNRLKFRGFLCSKCNSAIGFFDENIDILKNAIEYIQNFEKLQTGISSNGKTTVS